MGNSYTKYSVSVGNKSFSGLKEPDKENGGFRNMQSRAASISHGSSPYPDFITKLSEVLEMKSHLEEGKDGIGRLTFQKYLMKASNTAARRLYDYFLTKEGIVEESEENYSTRLLSKDAFNRQSFALLNCLTDSQQLEYYIKVFSNDKEEISYNDVYELVLSCYEVVQFTQNNEQSNSDDFLSSVSKAIMHGKDHTTVKYIFNWLCQHCPRIATWLHRYVSHMLTVGYSTIPENLPTEEVLYKDQVTPVLEGACASSSSFRYPSLIWLLSCSLPPVYTKNTSTSISPEESLSSLKEPRKFINRLILADKPSHWVALFNSDEHGLSINRLQHHVFDYHGPTLLIITCDEETMFGVACDEEWKDSKHFYGGRDALCFKLYPEFKVIEKGPKIIYFNITSRGFPTGLQVGSDSAYRALEMDVNLQLVHYRKIPYKLKTLEVWGCGTAHIREKQMEYKKMASKDVEKRRKVNINMEWKDHPDRYLLELAGTRPAYARFEKETQSQSSHK